MDVAINVFNCVDLDKDYLNIYYLLMICISR
jgi:hypothetical protein